MPKDADSQLPPFLFLPTLRRCRGSARRGKHPKENASTVLHVLASYGKCTDAPFLFSHIPDIVATQIKTRRRTSKHPCVIIFSDRDYIDHRVEDQPVECELQATDIINNKKHSVVRVKGVTTRWARKNAVLSGETTLYAPKSVIDDMTNSLFLPTGGTIEVSRSSDAYIAGKVFQLHVRTNGTKKDALTQIRFLTP